MRLRPWRWFRLAGLAGIFLAGGLRAQTSNEPAIVTRTLPNGLQVVVFPDATVPLATVEMAIRMGSVYETAADNGLAHLYEHMFFRTNQAQVSHEGYLEGINLKGISYNGSTSEERANFYLTGLSTHLDTMLHFLCDSVRRPVFAPEEVSNEIAVVLGEMDRNESNVYGQLGTRALELLFPANPTFKSPMGLRPVIRAATPDQMRAMHDRMVGPANAVLVVTGDCDPAEVFRLSVGYFGNWAHTGAAGPAVPDPGPGPARPVGEVIESPGVENPLVMFAWRGPSSDSDPGATYAADVLSQVLRQPGSRFRAALVDTGLVIDVDGNYYTQQHVGQIAFTLQIAPGKAREAVRVFKEQLGKFLSPGYISDQELENARAALAANDLFAREKPTEYAHTIGFWAVSTGVSYLLGQQQAYRGTNRDDIARYLRRYVLAQPYAAVALVAPGESGKSLAPTDLTQP